MTRVRVPILLVLLAVAAQADAQTFGTFTWQMQPYCNRVTLTLSSTPGGFRLDGSDDQCGAAKKGGAAGQAVFNGDGTVALNFTIVTAPSAYPVHVSASVSPSTGQGAWADDAGNSGTFTFFASTGGLPPRPAEMEPLDVDENPGHATDPCLGPTPQPLVLCGTDAARWAVSNFGFRGPQVWRNRVGEVHIRGSVSRSTGTLTEGSMFVLPPRFTPKRTLTFPVVAGPNGFGLAPGGPALVVVYGSDIPHLAGHVYLFAAATPAGAVVHLGELVFRVQETPRPVLAASRPEEPHDR